MKSDFAGYIIQLAGSPVRKIQEVFGLYQLGDILFERYEIAGFLGEGSFGRVYLARQINLNALVAIKCIDISADFAGIASREADILTNLKHPDIPMIYDIEKDDEHICIIEEYIEGESLENYISKTGSISVGKLIDISLKLCNIVKYLHEKGIYHGDIKPQNIILCEDTIKLLDYGNSVKAGDASFGIGTIKFAAPEMYESGKIDERTDIYAIGVVMLYMATKTTDSDYIRRIRPDKLGRIINACISHSQRGRTASVDELIRQLHHIRPSSAQALKNSMTIAFVKMSECVGCTHLSMMSAGYFTGKGKRVLIEEHNDKGHFISMVADSEHCRFMGGIIKMNRLELLPNYYGIADLRKSVYDVIIKDYGLYRDADHDEIMGCDRICLVTSAASYDLLSLTENLSVFEGRREDIRTLINLAGASQYRNAVRKYHVIHPVKVPYKPEL